MDLELELFGDLKQQEKTLINGSGGGGGGGSGSGGGNNPGSNSSIGKVFMLSLSSQPVDHEDASGRGKVGSYARVLVILCWLLLAQFR